MSTKILCIFVLFCASGYGSADFFNIERDLGISHAKVKPFYGCETTAFPPNESLLVPTYSIDLALQPRLRWTELIQANKEALVAMVGHVYNLTEAVMGETAVRFLLGHLGKIIDSIPHVYREELEGIAEASGLELEQITFYNIFYEIFSFCTSIVVQDTQGELYHGRNLDFGLFLGWNNATHEWRVAEMLRPLVAQLEWRNSTSVVYTSVTFAGYIGVVTANKPGVFSFSVNERFSWNGGYVGLVEWIVFGDHNQSWLALLTREVLLEAASYQDAVERLSAPRLVAPVYFTLAGTQPGQGCIITRYRDNYELLELGSQNYLSTWYLVQTNYDHWKPPPFYDDRRTPAASCLDSGRNSSSRGVVGVEPLRLADLGGSDPSSHATTAGDLGRFKNSVGRNNVEASEDANKPAVNPQEGEDLSDVKSVDKNIASTEPMALLYNVLSTRPVLNKLTTYTTLMSAKKGYIKSWLRSCQDPCWPW